MIGVRVRSVLNISQCAYILTGACERARAPRDVSRLYDFQECRVARRDAERFSSAPRARRTPRTLSLNDKTQKRVMCN